MSEMDDRETALDAPEADAVEQALTVRGEDEEEAPRRSEIPFDADEADAVEQDRVVELDEDDYR